MPVLHVPPLHGDSAPLPRPSQTSACVSLHSVVPLLPLQTGTRYVCLSSEGHASQVIKPRGALEPLIYSQKHGDNRARGGVRAALWDCAQTCGF